MKTPKLEKAPFSKTATALRFWEKHSFPTELAHQHCAVIHKGKVIISIGYNRYRLNIYTEENKHRDLCSIHAEIDALGKAKGKDLRGTTITIVRRSPRTGLTMLSLPCPMCLVAITEAGIKRVYYS